ATWDLPRATVVTDALGQFSVTLDDKVFATSARVITFRVLDPNGASLTNPTQGWDPTQLDHLLTLIVSGAAAVRTYVSGYVRNRDGTVVSGATVQALSRKMRTEDIVGST